MTETETIREQVAADEREAIIEIIERYSRHLAHGHGVTGAQVLQQILEEIRRRGGGRADS
jgi:hypothetical protein